MYVQWLRGSMALVKQIVTGRRIAIVMSCHISDVLAFPCIETVPWSQYYCGRWPVKITTALLVWWTFTMVRLVTALATGYDMSSQCKAPIVIDRQDDSHIPSSLFSRGGIVLSSHSLALHRFSLLQFETLPLNDAGKVQQKYILPNEFLDSQYVWALVTL